MRIIKRGKLITNEVSYECKICGTAFTYTKSDVIIDHRDGDYILCPLCGKSIASAFNR